MNTLDKIVVSQYDSIHSLVRKTNHWSDEDWAQYSVEDVVKIIPSSTSNPSNHLLSKILTIPTQSLFSPIHTWALNNIYNNQEYSQLRCLVSKWVQTNIKDDQSSDQDIFKKIDYYVDATNWSKLVELVVESDRPELLLLLKDSHASPTPCSGSAINAINEISNGYIVLFNKPITIQICGLMRT